MPLRDCQTFADSNHAKGCEQKTGARTGDLNYGFVNVRPEQKDPQQQYGADSYAYDECYLGPVRAHLAVMSSFVGMAVP
jgi:hypothetical protein